jgi:hypothetical protein
MYDAYATWLRFQASPEVVKELVALGFERSDRHTFEAETVNANSPKWWMPDTDRLTHFYSADPWRKEHLRSHAVIAYNDEQTIVYFHRNDSD